MNDIVAFTAQWALLVPALIVLLAIVARKRWRGDLLEAALAGLVTMVFVKMGGILHVESRPFVVDHLQPLIPHVADNAFPSDHLAATGLAFAFLWPRSKALSLLVLCVAALLGAARVLARLHWPDDIVSGFAMGAAAVLIAQALLALATRRIAPRA